MPARSGGGRGGRRTPATTRHTASARKGGKSTAKKKTARHRPASGAAANKKKKTTSARRSAARKGRHTGSHVTPTRRITPTRELAAEYYRRLAALYPHAHCALDFRNPYELLVATILSAQTTDVRVNQVTPALFERYPDAASLADADIEELETLIKSTGFYHNKAKSLLGMARAVVARHDGEIPSTMDELTALPGVGRKTANVVLGNAFDRNDGIVVDTHVTRLANRLGLTRQHDAVKIEQDLMRLFDRPRWTMLSHLLIEHGRKVCIARRPRCEECPLADLCPSSLV